MQQQQAQQQTIQQLQQHLNSIRNLINAVPFLTNLQHVQNEAQQAFRDFDGNPANLTPKLFDYLNKYVQMNQRIEADNSIFKQHQMEVTSRLNLIHNNVEAHEHFTERRWELEQQWNEIIGRRDVLREFLISRGYATHQQLEEGFDQQQQQGLQQQQVPRRFQINNLPVARELVVEHLTLLQDKFDIYPTVDYFNEVMVQAQEAIDYVELYPGEEILADNHFDYINLFKTYNKMFVIDETAIRDSFALLGQIHRRQPNAFMARQSQELLDLWKTFDAIYKKRNEVRDKLVLRQLATPDQLRNGYDGEHPAAFKPALGMVKRDARGGRRM